MSRRKKSKAGGKPNDAKPGKSAKAKSRQPETKSRQPETTPRKTGLMLGVGVILLGGLLALLWSNWPAPESPTPVTAFVATQDDLTVPRLGDSWESLDNPEDEGWHTEVFSDSANHQLKELGKLLLDEELDETKLAELLASGFQCGDLLPPTLNQVYQDQTVEVQRLDKSVPGDSKAHRETVGLAKALGDIMQPFSGASDKRFKFKLFNVEPSDGVTLTRQYFSLSGQTKEGMLEQNATWVMTWETDDSEDEAYPLLASIEVEEFEQVRTSNGEAALFADCTQSALDPNESYRRQLLRGYHYWLGRTESRPYWERLGTPGLAVGDANGDGLDDLYLCQERGLPNLLFLQQPDGTARDVSELSKTNWLEDSRSALFVDLDNDGDQDLVVGVSGGVVLAENDGKAQFSVRNVLPSQDDVKSISAVDYDRDGRLDLYATVYFPNVLESHEGNIGADAVSLDQVIYDSNQGGSNSLFRNEIGQGEWRFDDVTREAGLDEKNARYSLAASWEDFDSDGDQDLYVANDYGRNSFYRNDDGKFVEISGEAGVEDFNLAMSAAWGDYDRDGHPDLYVGNMFSAAGNRVTFQRQFRPESSDEEKQRFQHMARGNTLFKNAGDGSFQDVSAATGVTMGRWAWSTNFVDLNNDGWQDLIVANGMITTEDTGDC